MELAEQRYLDAILCSETLCDYPARFVQQLFAEVLISRCQQQESERIACLIDLEWQRFSHLTDWEVLLRCIIMDGDAYIEHATRLESESTMQFFVSPLVEKVEYIVLYNKQLNYLWYALIRVKSSCSVLACPDLVGRAVGWAERWQRR